MESRRCLRFKHVKNLNAWPIGFLFSRYPKIFRAIKGFSTFLRDCSLANICEFGLRPTFAFVTDVDTSAKLTIITDHIHPSVETHTHTCLREPPRLENYSRIETGNLARSSSVIFFVATRRPCGNARLWHSFAFACEQKPVRRSPRPFRPYRFGPRETVLINELVESENGQRSTYAGNGDFARARAVLGSITANFRNKRRPPSFLPSRTYNAF